MKEPIVTDSTCLIGLERIDQLEVLQKLYKPVVIPPEVDREFGISLAWVKVESPKNKPLVTSLELLLRRAQNMLHTLY